jgi:hypothetical protein
MNKPLNSAAPNHTPWGEPHHQTVIAPGIVAVDTASHGGIWLSEKRVAEMPAWAKVEPTFVGRAKGSASPHTWWENDCDAAVPPLAFPDEYRAHWKRRGFTEAECDHYMQTALFMVRASRPATYAAYLDAQQEAHS